MDIVQPRRSHQIDSMHGLHIQNRHQSTHKERTLKAHHIALLMIAVATQGCDPFSGPKEAPQISYIDYSPSFGANTAEPVIFTAALSDDDHGPYTYRWDFGDGQTSTSQRPGHKFESSGTYAVSVTVENSVGSDTDTISVRVDNPDSDLYFWTNTTIHGFITVYINGMARTISRGHYQFQGCAKNQGYADFVDMPYGTYEYFATAQSGMSWRGVVTLNDNCTNILLN
ncbi:PKD domain-containing protein [Myxococcus sp. Y35]|uniref:PKD domain-containing protein n=1 Tax=Pseudomyxococcus flavus TaxID=3115648 RepID=UPI003CE97267